MLEDQSIDSSRWSITRYTLSLNRIYVRTNLYICVRTGWTLNKIIAAEYEINDDLFNTYVPTCVFDELKSCWFISSLCLAKISRDQLLDCLSLDNAFCFYIYITRKFVLGVLMVKSKDRGFLKFHRYTFITLTNF